MVGHRGITSLLYIGSLPLNDIIYEAGQINRSVYVMQITQDFEMYTMQICISSFIGKIMHDKLSWLNKVMMKR